MRTRSRRCSMPSAPCPTVLPAPSCSRRETSTPPAGRSSDASAHPSCKTPEGGWGAPSPQGREGEPSSGSCFLFFDILLRQRPDRLDPRVQQAQALEVVSVLRVGQQRPLADVGAGRRVLSLPAIRKLADDPGGKPVPVGGVDER